MIDPEILDGFKEESLQLINELQGVVSKLEEGATGPFPSALLEEFAQKIDRVMGAAQTIEMFEPGHAGLVRIGKICQLSKKLGYTASEKKNPAWIPIFAGFWADTLESLTELVENLNDEVKTKEAAQALSAYVQKRLTWLGQKVGLDPALIESMKSL